MNSEEASNIDRLDDKVDVVGQLPSGQQIAYNQKLSLLKLESWTPAIASSVFFSGDYHKKTVKVIVHINDADAFSTVMRFIEARKLTTG